MITPPPSLSRRRRLGALIVLLSLATAAATYLQGALSVLSTYLIAEFDVTPSAYGLAFTVFSLTGGIGSPLVGRLVDASARRVMVGLFSASTLGILGVAGAPRYGWVLVAAFCAGLAVAAANPVTNKLVSEEMPVVRQGLVIGLKQAGPPMSLLAAGFVLPPLASLLGWRWALAVTAILPVVGLGATRFLVPERRRPAARPAPARSRGSAGRTTVWWLGVMGFTRALGGGSVIAFLPLYTVEELGFSAALAGLVAAVIGLSGVLGRVAWGAGAARFPDPTALLTVLAALALCSSTMIWAAAWIPVLVWVGAVAAGFSIISWLAVSWFALLVSVDPSTIGRSTGLIQFATSAGIAVGPIVVGVLIDAAGSYSWAWGFVVGSFAVTLGLTLLWRRSLAAETGSPVAAPVGE